MLLGPENILIPHCVYANENDLMVGNTALFVVASNEYDTVIHIQIQVSLVRCSKTGEQSLLARICYVGFAGGLTVLFMPARM